METNSKFADETWTLERSWPARQFPDVDLETLNEVAPEGYRYRRSESRRASFVDLEREVGGGADGG